MAKLTGERPVQGLTPDTILAEHAAGYREVISRLGSGRVLDVGCGQGFESVGLGSPGRIVIGVDYDAAAVSQAEHRSGGRASYFACMDARQLAVASGTIDWVCSSHLIEHFAVPERHAAESARVLAPGGTAFFLTPNAPADFENPFHIHLFTQSELASLLSVYFADVWVGAIDGSPEVKEDMRLRRRRGKALLALDPLRLRRRIPRSWYVTAYVRLLPLAYRLLARSDTGGRTAFSADDFFVTDHIDETTRILFAVARQPRRRCSPALSGEGIPDQEASSA
jgi:SAM-dependent methyltransferase